MEWFKDLSDKLIIWVLRATSGFAKELTPDGVKEQILWREQRLKNLRGLALRSRQRFNGHQHKGPATFNSQQNSSDIIGNRDESRGRP